MSKQIKQRARIPGAVVEMPVAILAAFPGVAEAQADIRDDGEVR